MSGHRSRSPRDRWERNTQREDQNYTSNRGGYERPDRSSNYGSNHNDRYRRNERYGEDRRHFPPDQHPSNYGRQDFQEFRRERRDDRRDYGNREGQGGSNGYDYGRRDRQHEYGERSGNRVVNPEAAEEQRLLVSSRYPNRLFLEEVELPPEFAFRLDNNSDNQLLAKEATKFSQKSAFVPSYYRDNLLGASEEYQKKFRTFSFRCKPPAGIDDEGNAIGDDEASPGPISSTANIPGKRPASSSAEKPIEFMKLLKERGSSSDKREKKGNNSKGEQGFAGLSAKKPEMSLRDKIEYYNSELRKDSKNIGMWRAFVLFQDIAFEQDRAREGESRKKSDKAYNKLLVEKKVAILEKAVAQNPRCTELQVLRLDFVNEIFKPTHTLSEWKKLVANNQQVPSFWLESLRHSSTQLQIYSSSSFTKDCQIFFERFRTMLTPSYPDFQRPAKSHLLLSDLRYSLCIMLRSAGLTERALAINQAQLELDFNVPAETLKGMNQGKSEWKAMTKLFELFWNLGTLRFGEPGALGWAKVLQCQSESFGEKVSHVGVSDTEVSSLEDLFFESLGESGSADEESSEQANQKLNKSENWLYIESVRSKLYWTPWRASASDLDECDDSQRVVLANEIIPFLIRPPMQLYKDDFEMDAAYFRNVVNYLQTFEPDFLPRTHTLESVLSPFTSVALSDSKILFSEIYYWKTYLQLYHSSPNIAGDRVPEGFTLSEFTLPSTASVLPGSNKLKILSQYSESVEVKRNELLKENQQKHTAMLNSVVSQSVEHLSPKFASLLVQMFFRFSQKCTNEDGWSQEYKRRIKFMKSLMKHEKLRNSTAAYGELGLLEYFSGKKQKGIDVLARTINSTSKLLKVEDGQVPDLSTNWEGISEITKLYRLVAEFYLMDKSEVSLSVLVSLGNNFDIITLPSSDGAEVTKSTKNAILKAKRLFEGVMDSIVPKSPTKDNEHETEESQTDEDCMLKWSGEHVIEYFTQNVNLVIEWTLAFGLFRYLSEGFDAACEVFHRVLDKIGTPEPLSRTSQYNTSLVNAHHIRESVYINFTKLGAMAVARDPTQNGKFRTVLGKALEEFPSSPPLLLLFSDIESQCSVAGKLWRAMVSLVKQESSPKIATLHWAPIFMCLSLANRIDEIERDSEIAIDSFGLGGPAVPPDTIFYKLDALLTAAEKNVLTRHCPLIWRVHLKHLALRAKEGKDVRRAHGLFYDAVRHCPTSKALYMDAISYFPEMMKEVLDLMAEKQLLVRLPVEELDLLLEIEAEAENEAGVRGKIKQAERVLSDGELDNDEESIVEVSD